MVFCNMNCLGKCGENEMIVTKLFVWFILFSFMGWIYETIYCTITNHKWQNRGFLFGPICPIYGAGGVAAAIVCTGEVLPEMNWWQIFVVCFLGSVVLEYVTSYVLEKLFHAVWWDYSDVFCNINGRVCLPASLGFGIAGLLVVNYIVPFAKWLTGPIAPLAMEVLALLFMGLLAADLALTVSALTSLVQSIQKIESSVNTQMEAFYDNLETSVAEKKQAVVDKNAEKREERLERKEEKALRKEERQLTNMAKRQELYATATESFARFMNLGQKHALHSVKEFRYKDNKVSNMLIRVEKEIADAARSVKKVAGQVKDTTVDKLSARTTKSKGESDEENS